MSASAEWLRFARRGGSPPRDDEELAITVDGAFAARRTIGGPRIGSFAGQLPAAVLARLRSLVDGVRSAEDLTLPTPRHGATESLEVGGQALQLGSNESPPKPWRSLLDAVRGLLEGEVEDAPHAAVQLIADARSARLVHAGAATLDVDLGSVVVRVVCVADAGGVLARWNGRATEGLMDNGERLVPTPAWATAGPGWSAALPFDHAIDLAPGDMLQVWVDIPIRGGEGERAGRLYVPVLADD